MSRKVYLGTTLTVLLLGLGIAGRALAGNINAQEMPLNPSGSVSEIHTDAQGNLWISDLLAGQIWNVTAVGDGYTAYSVGGYPSDAQPDGLGNVWWVDSTTIGSLNLTGKTTQAWNVSVSTHLGGLGFDSTGKIWLTDTGSANIYRFDPSSGETCTYPLPTTSAQVFYPLVIGTQLWLADSYNGQIVRLDFSGTPGWTSWQLPVNSTPYFVTQDASGNIWFTDDGLAQLGRLTPVSGELTLYPLPMGTSPLMLSASANKIWYTEQSLTSIGSLDPAHNSAQPVVVTPSTATASSTCVTLNPPTSGSANVSSGVPSWANASYSTIVQGNGWVVYQLPTNSLPAGMAIQNELGFVTDSARHVLIRFSTNSSNVYLPIVVR